MTDQISVSSGSDDELVVSVPPSAPPLISSDIMELAYPDQMSGILNSEWDEAVLFPPWVPEDTDAIELDGVQPPAPDSSSEAGSGSETESEPAAGDEENYSSGDREEDKSASETEFLDPIPTPGGTMDGGELDEISALVAAMEREKREVELESEERIKRFQRETEELQASLSELRSEKEQRARLSLLSGTDLISMVQRKDREVSFLTEEVDKYTKRLSELSSAKLSEQSQLEKALKEDERLRLRESAMQQQKEYESKRSEWLEEELSKKSREAIELKTCLQEQITALEEEGKSHARQLEDVRSELNAGIEGKEKLRGRLDACLSELDSCRDERCLNEDRHRQEVLGQKKLATLYKESAEQSEEKVAELLMRAEQLQRAVAEKEQALRETELRVSEERRQLSSLRDTLQSRVAEVETELRHANEMLEKVGVGRRGLFQCEGKTETITEIYSKYVEATTYIQDLEEDNARIKLNLETYKNSVNEKIPLLRRQKEENDYLKRSNKELREQLDKTSSELEKTSSESDIAVRRSRFLERENLKQSSTIRELNTQLCVLLRECEEYRGVSISSFSFAPEEVDTEVSSSSGGRVISFRSLEELQARNVELMSRARQLESELEQMKGAGQDERTRETQKRVEELTLVVEHVKESKRQQTEIIQSIIRDRDKYKSLLAQTTPLPSEAPSAGPDETGAELRELQESFDNHKRQSEVIRKELISELGEVKEAKSHLELEIDRLDSKLGFASERQELLKNWYESQRGESQSLREKNDHLLKHLADLEQSSRETMQEQFKTRDRLSRLEFQKENLERKNESLKASEEWSKNQIEILLREKNEQKLLKANIEMIHNSLERSELETKSRASQQVVLLEEELRHTRSQLEQKDKQQERVVQAWERQVEELKTSLHTTHETHTQSVSVNNNQSAKIHDLQSVLATTHKKVELRDRELSEAKDNLRKAESGALVMDLQEESSGMKLRLAELEQAEKALQSRVSKATEHMEHYKSISEAAEQQIKETLEANEMYRNDVEAKLMEAEDRQAGWRDELSERDIVCGQLRESMEQLETAHAAELERRRIELQYTKNLLKEAQANLALLEEKEAMAREDVLLHERVSQETQDKYEREVIEHGKTVEGYCRSKDELSALKIQLQSAEQQATEHLFKLEESTKSWEDLNEIEKKRIEQLMNQLTDTQSQNKLLFSQLESLNAKILTLQSSRDTADLTTEKAPSPQSVLTASESEDQLRELIRHIRREKEIVETKYELAESERSRLSELCRRFESELEETRTALAGEQEALRAQAETVAQHSQLLEKVNTLNLLQESNRVLREDKNLFEGKSSSLSTQLKEKVEELFSAKESNKTLSSQKDTLLAEKTALKNELARWQARVNHLLEVYDKMDPEEFRQLQTLKDEHMAKIANLSDSVKQIGEERNEQKYRIKLLEDKVTQLQSESETCQERQATELKEINDKLREKEEELKTKAENCKRFGQAARNWKNRFEEKTAKFQEIEKNLNELKTSNLQEKSRTEEEWQERQQELNNMNQGLETEKTTLQEQLNETKAALEEKSKKVERMQDGLKKLNIKVRQQTKGLEEKVTTLKTENSQLKTANADKEGQLQAVKNLHQSQVSQLEAKLKLESSSKVSSTQPPPPPPSILPNKVVATVRPNNNKSIPVVNPICREQMPVSIPPFTSSLVTSTAQPSSSLPSILQSASELPKYIPGAIKQTPTNFNLSHVQQDLLGVTTRSGSKRRREEAEVPTTSTADPQGKKNKVLTTLPFDSQQPTSLTEGNSVIDSSTTTSHSPNSTYGTPTLVIDETISSNLQAVPSSEDMLPSAMFSELSPNPAPESLLPDQSSSPPRLMLPPNFEHFGMDVLEQQVPNTPILVNRNTQLGHTIPGHSSTGHSVPPDSSSINIASDEGLANDHELDFGLGSDIQAHNSSQEDNLYGEFPSRSVDVSSPNRVLPFSSNGDSPSSTPGPQVSTSTHNQNPLSSQQDDLPPDHVLSMLPETSEVPLIHIHADTEEPTSAGADGIARFDMTEPSEGVTSIETPQELAYEQLSSSDGEPPEREEPPTVVSSDELDSGDPDDDGYEQREVKRGGSIESVSDGEVDDLQQQRAETGEQLDAIGFLPETSGRPNVIVPIRWEWDDTPNSSAPATQSKPARRVPAASGNVTTPSSKGTGHKGKKLIQRRPPK